MEHKSARREASPNEEVLLWWYFAKNVKSIRKRPRYFQRMLNQQRKIKRYLGWGFRKQTDDERMAELREIFNALQERFAFDADLDREVDDDDGEYEGTYDVEEYER